MSEKTYRAWLAATASTTVEFKADVDDLPEDDRRDALEEAAYAAFQGVILCHQCAREADLGDFEVGTGEDDIEEVA